MRIATLLIAAALAAGCGSHARAPAKHDFRLVGPPRDRVDLTLDVAEPMMDALDENGDNERTILAAATTGERYVYAIVEVDGEINNGGFDQLFWNSAGSLYGDALAGARAANARPALAVLRQAASLFPDARVPRGRARRQHELDALTPAAHARLGRLDERWYATDAELDHALRGYILAHPSQFFRRG